MDDVNTCENHDPRKWQAMHDANACENYMCEGVTRGQPRPIDLKSSFISSLSL